jgi:hypothetical protein
VEQCSLILQKSIHNFVFDFTKNSPYLYYMNTDKKFNVWTIKNKSGQFSNITRNNNITWEDNIYKASFFNHNNASLIVQSQGLKDVTIVKVS